jgi:hypothetical protein
MLLLSGCQTKMAARQAQRDLKTLVETSELIFEHDHVALLHCGNFADHEQIKTCITQTKRAVDIWFGDKPKDYTSRLLIFSPDEPLGKRLASEMQSTTHVAGNTEARTHTILISGYPSQKSFWTTLRHELTHDAMLRHYDSPELLPPFWITEGMATVFEVPAFADGKPAINPNRLDRLKSIAAQNKLDIMPLISRPSDTRSGIRDYAQAWGLTFFLMRQNSAGMRHYLAQYQLNATSTPDHQSIFAKCFINDQSMDKLSEQIIRWCEIQTSH